MRHLAICGVLCLLAGCGGQTGIDDGLDGLHGGGSGGSELTAAGGSGTGAGTSASGGATGGSADRGTGGTVAGDECTSNDQCATPALCKVCSGGGSSCAQGECVNGTCSTYFPPCGVPASGGASGAGGDPGAGGAATGGATSSSPCTVNSDCPDHEICGFPTADACAAKGSCFPAPGVECNAIVLGCACDGGMVNLACNGLPGGYAPKPVLHSGACTN